MHNFSNDCPHCPFIFYVRLAIIYWYHDPNAFACNTEDWLIQKQPVVRDESTSIIQDQPYSTPSDVFLFSYKWCMFSVIKFMIITVNLLLNRTTLYKFIIYLTIIANSCQQNYYQISLNLPFVVLYYVVIYVVWHLHWHK